MSLNTIYKFMVKLKLSRKRVRTRGISKKPVAELADQYRHMFRTHESAGNVLVSVDECGFSERLRTLYGYSRKGEPCIIRTSGSWKNHSLLLAVYSTGEKRYVIQEKSITKNTFTSFVDGIHDADRRLVVIADNASIHKNLQLQTPVQMLYTPPYEPDSNPIEMCFARVKHVFRARNTGIDIPGLIRECVEEAVTPELIAGCFDHVRRTYVM